MIQLNIKTNFLPFTLKTVKNTINVLRKKNRKKWRKIDTNITECSTSGNIYSSGSREGSGTVVLRCQMTSLGTRSISKD